MGRRSGGIKQCVMRALHGELNMGARAESDSPYRYVKTWCGKTELMGERERALSPKLASCPKCSAAIGKAKMAALPRLELVRRESPINGYQRSTYDVMIDGALRGYVSISNGWGEHWNLYRLKGPEERFSHYDNGPMISGSRLDSWQARAALERGESFSFWPVHHASKEAMAVAAWHAFERGHLPTVADMEAARAERLAREAEREAESKAAAAKRAAEREREAELRLERVELWRAALESLGERGDLTNVELAGLDAIRKLLPI